MPKRKRIVSNDDGWIMSQILAPVTESVIRETIVDTYAGSALDTLSWCVGDASTQRYETIEALSWPNHLPPGGERRESARNLARLIESSGGPVTLFARLCHEAGLKFLPSVRMNSHYDQALSSVSPGRLRRDHPEWLIGRPDEDHPRCSTPWGIRTGLDYARAGVRSSVAALAIDLFERFDTDGVELDFMRHPAFFRVEEAYGARHLVTDMLREIRARMDEVSAARGRELELLVRVPPTLSDSARIGLDVETWIREGVVNAVAAGGGFIPLHAPIEEFSEAAAGTGCETLGPVESLRPATELDSLHAIASRHCEGGADGFYLFNFWHKSADWKRRAFDTLSDPDKLARAPKRYDMEYMERLTPNDLHAYAFRHAVPAVQLPAQLGFTLAGRGTTLILVIGDDLEGAAARSEIASCQLELQLSEFSAEDEIEVVVNGVTLPSDAASRRFGSWSRQEWTRFPSRLAQVEYGGGVIVYDLAGPPFRRGVNSIEIFAIMRTVMQDAALSLRGVELRIAYAA